MPSRIRIPRVVTRALKVVNNADLLGSKPSAAQMAYLVGITPGTVTASKALIADANKALSGLGSLTQDITVATAALGTVRGLHGQVTASHAAISGGNLVGVRGLATLSGAISAGGAYLYGAQGKLVVTGTMNHADSRLTAGLSQLDATGGTLTAGQLSGHWIDVVGITGAGGGQFNLLRMTANAAAVPNALIYAQADATYALELIKPSGGNQSYIAAAGTNAASAGAATGVATKVMIVSIDGVAYYIPLFAGNT